MTRHELSRPGEREVHIHRHIRSGDEIKSYARRLHIGLCSTLKVTPGELLEQVPDKKKARR